jgi:hypothetical protein
MHISPASILSAPLWHTLHAPVIGGAATAAIALAGRVLGASWLQASAGPAGVAIGWTLLTGGLTGSPRLLVERLPAVGIAALVLALGGEAFAAARGRLIGAILLAAAIGWWLAGGPQTRADLLQAGPVFGGTAALILLLQYAARDQGGAGLVGAAAALVLALKLTGVSLIWPLIAGTILAVSCALLALPGAAAGLPPAVADLGAASAATIIAAGRLPRGGFGPADLAALMPLLAFWLGPRLTPRLRFAGPFAAILAALLAAGLCGVLVRLAPLLIKPE